MYFKTGFMEKSPLRIEGPSTSRDVEKGINFPQPLPPPLPSALWEGNVSVPGLMQPFCRLWNVKIYLLTHPFGFAAHVWKRYTDPKNVPHL